MELSVGEQPCQLCRVICREMTDVNQALEVGPLQTQERVQSGGTTPQQPPGGIVRRTNAPRSLDDERSELGPRCGQSSRRSRSSSAIAAERTATLTKSSALAIDPVASRTAIVSPLGSRMGLA